jgi:hypothetical protein
MAWHGIILVNPSTSLLLSGIGFHDNDNVISNVFLNICNCYSAIM